jgi:histidine triad (HIT) family protein
MNECIFCRIVAGEAPSSVVLRDKLVTAFLDIRPVTPGHLLVVPNAHVVLVQDLPVATAAHLFEVARRLASALRTTRALRADGINFFAADGEAAGQEVSHAHLHLIPRFAGDGFEIEAAAWREPAPTREQLDDSAARIRSAANVGPEGF